MIKTTLREIKESDAFDITNIKQGNKLYNELQPLHIIAYSTGVYGRTGLLLYSDKTKSIIK